jgi:hypothetical protein
MSTALQKLIEEGKVTVPYVRALFYFRNEETRKEGWRIQAVQSMRVRGSQNQNSLLRASLGISMNITLTAILTSSEKFVSNLEIDGWDYNEQKNVFFVGENSNGDAVNLNIPGEYIVADKLITVAEAFNATSDFDLQPEDVTIELIESFTQNPYRPSQQPVLNPETKKHTMVPGPDGKQHVYFRHTDLRLTNEAADNQYIADYTKKVKAGEEVHLLSPVSAARLLTEKPDVYFELLNNPYKFIDLSESAKEAEERAATEELLSGISAGG